MPEIRKIILKSGFPLRKDIIYRIRRIYANPNADAFRISIIIFPYDALYCTFLNGRVAFINHLGRTVIQIFAPAVIKLCIKTAPEKFCHISILKPFFQLLHRNQVFHIGKIFRVSAYGFLDTVPQICILTAIILLIIQIFIIIISKALHRFRHIFAEFHIAFRRRRILLNVFPVHRLITVDKNIHLKNFVLVIPFIPSVRRQHVGGHIIHKSITADIRFHIIGVGSIIIFAVRIHERQYCPVIQKFFHLLYGHLVGNILRSIVLPFQQIFQIISGRHILFRHSYVPIIICGHIDDFLTVKYSVRLQLASNHAISYDIRYRSAKYRIEEFRFFIRFFLVRSMNTITLLSGKSLHNYG